VQVVGEGFLGSDAAMAPPPARVQHDANAFAYRPTLETGDEVAVTLHE